MQEQKYRPPPRSRNLYLMGEGRPRRWAPFACGALTVIGLIALFLYGFVRSVPLKPLSIAGLAARKFSCGGTRDMNLCGFNGWPMCSSADVRCRPHRRPRTARGRCGSLLLHRIGLAPTTHCRSPGALRKIPYLSRHHGLFGNIHFDLIASRPPASSHQLSFRTSESLPRM